MYSPACSLLNLIDLIKVPVILRTLFTSSFFSLFARIANCHSCLLPPSAPTFRAMESLVPLQPRPSISQVSCVSGNHELAWDFLSRLRKIRLTRCTWVEDIRERVAADWKRSQDEYQSWLGELEATISDLRCRDDTDGASYLMSKLVVDPAVYDPDIFTIMIPIGVGAQFVKIVSISGPSVPPNPDGPNRLLRSLQSLGSHCNIDDEMAHLLEFSREVHIAVISGDAWQALQG